MTEEKHYDLHQILEEKQESGVCNKAKRRIDFPLSANCTIFEKEVAAGYLSDTNRSL